MSLRSGTQKYGSEGVWVTESGYTRNLALEDKLKRDSQQADDSIKNNATVATLGRVGVPSWWDRVTNPADPSQGYGFGYDTHQKALDYLKLAQRYFQAKINLFNYQCSNYPRDPTFCQHSTQYSGTLGTLNSLIPIIENRITDFQFPEILPQVFAEEDPSILQSDETVTVTHDRLTWYYVQKPSGICERLKLTENLKQKFEEKGWKISLTNICVTEEPEPEQTFAIVEYSLVDNIHGKSVHQVLRYNVSRSYLNGLDSSNVMWKLQGQGYTNQEVYDFYNYVLPPQPGEDEPFTQCVDVYRWIPSQGSPSNGIVHATRETVDRETLSDYTGQGVLVRECGQSVPSNQEVRDYYGVPGDDPDCPCGGEFPFCKECPPSPEPEPGQVNWIPEPFFSFINSVFRK